MYTLTLETMDFDNDEFKRYLKIHKISAEQTGNVYGGPGGGEDVIYTATTREALEAMYSYFWNSGCDEQTAEDLAKISQQ